MNFVIFIDKDYLALLLGLCSKLDLSPLSEATDFYGLSYPGSSAVPTDFETRGGERDGERIPDYE